MEQGPVLEAAGVAVAPVAAIAGQTRLFVTVSGSQVVPLCLLKVKVASPKPTSVNPDTCPDSAKVWSHSGNPLRVHVVHPSIAKGGCCMAWPEQNCATRPHTRI